jgi:endonuclease/exonuclease/phosphatase (EEP) superfamily protein YafD
MMAELGFHDAIADVPGNTHWWPLARVPLSNSTFLALKSRLDHVFFSGRLAAAVTTVDHRYEGNASDHLPVVVTLRCVDDAALVARPVKVSTAWTLLRVGFVQVHPESIWV